MLHCHNVVDFYRRKFCDGHNILLSLAHSFCSYGYTTPTSDIRSSSSWYDDAQQQQQQFHQQQQQFHQQQQQYHQQQQQYQQQQMCQYNQDSAPADPETAMDESMARIASTFPTDEPPDILLSATPGHFSPEVTPAMPLLPDMPTRSRKLLENLGSSPIQPSRSGSGMYFPKLYPVCRGAKYYDLSVIIVH